MNRLMQQPRWRGTRGATLIELAVVVAIVGVLATIAVVTYVNYLPHLRLNNSARTMAMDLLEAHQVATKENRTFYTIFYPSTEQYKVFRTTTGTPCTDTGHSRLWPIWNLLVPSAYAGHGSSGDTTSCDDGNSQDGTGGEQLYRTGTMATGVDLSTAVKASGASFTKLYFCPNGFLGLAAECKPTSNSFPLVVTLKRTSGGSDSRLLSVRVSGAVTVK